MVDSFRLWTLRRRIDVPVVEQRPSRFRKIQVCPKDLPSVPWQAELGSGQLPVQAHSAAARCSALNNAIKDEVHSRTAQTTILATGSAFALLMAALGDHAHGEGNAFKRMDRVTAEKGYAGPVVVCSVSYEPIAGHRSSTQLVKYLSEGREIEIALASVAGTRLLAPFRVLIVSMRKPGDRRQSV